MRCSAPSPSEGCSSGPARTESTYRAAAKSIVWASDYQWSDSEREWRSEEKPLRSDLHFQGWMLGLLATIGAFGFILGIFVYITAFLRVKAGVKWHWAIAGALGAVAVLSVFGHVFLLHYPQGLLQHVVDLPWPLE